MKIYDLSESCACLDNAGKMITVGDNVIQDGQCDMRAKDKAKFYTDRIISGMDILRVDRSSHAFPDHIHEDDYTLSLMIEGRSRCFGEKKQVVRTGGVVLINPGQVHSGKPVDHMPISYITLFFKKELCLNILGGDGKRTIDDLAFSGLMVEDPVLSKQIYAISELFFGPQNNSTNMELIHDLFEYLYAKSYLAPSKDKTGQPSSRDSRIVKAKQMLVDNPAEKQSLETISGRLGMNPYHFLRRFKKETGLTPHSYRNQKRIELAKKLLAHKVPLSQVALETGFSDQSHFNRRFKQFTGFTPKQLASC